MLDGQAVEHGVERFEFLRQRQPAPRQQTQCGRERLQHWRFAQRAKTDATVNGPLEPAFSSLTVTDASGKQVNTSKAVVDAQDHDAISLALPALQSGRYTVHWVAVASDGHRTHGDYSFEVK
ncbi:copper resistance CopC family protein [Paraburkholderia terrae]